MHIIHNALCVIHKKQGDGEVLSNKIQADTTAHHLRKKTVKEMHY